MVRGIISVKSEVAHLGATEEKQIRIVKEDHDMYAKGTKDVRGCKSPSPVKLI